MRIEAIVAKLRGGDMSAGSGGPGGIYTLALSAIDVALWDIKGKALNQPVWRLLGGAHPKVPVYATFGFGFFDREQLAAAAKLWVSQGFRKLKMTVGNEALRNRDKRPIMDVIKEDAARFRAVREAVGPDIELFVDANCNLDLYHAMKLTEMMKPHGLSFFEEPLTQNDVAGMAQLRRSTGVALACGSFGLRCTTLDSEAMLVGEAASSLSCASVVGAPPVTVWQPARAAAQVPAGASILVLPFDNPTQEARPTWLREGAAILLTEMLASAGEHAIDRDDRLQAFDRLQLPATATLSMLRVEPAPTPVAVKAPQVSAPSPAHAIPAPWLALPMPSNGISVPCTFPNSSGTSRYSTGRCTCAAPRFT